MYNGNGEEGHRVHVFTESKKLGDNLQVREARGVQETVQTLVVVVIITVVVVTIFVFVVVAIVVICDTTPQNKVNEFELRCSQA